MNLPTFFIWIAGLYFVAFSSEGKRFRAFAWAYVFVISLLLYFQGKDYYALGIYPVLFAFGAYHLETFAQLHSRVWKHVFVIIPVLLGILVIPILLPVAKPEPLSNYYRVMKTEKAGVLKWEDQKNHPLPQDFADMLGWEEMTQKMAQAYAKLDSNEKRNSILFCDNYGEAGAVNFYGNKYNLPEAYSDNGSFLFWIPKNKNVENIILITDDKQEMQHLFIKQFASAVAFDSVTNIYAREYGSLIIILKGPSEQFKNEFRKKIDTKYGLFKPTE
jgi:hypothetical protein